MIYKTFTFRAQTVSISHVHFQENVSKHGINKLKILYKPTRIMRIRALLLGTSRSNGLSARFMSPYHTQDMEGSTRSTCCLVTRNSQESKQCLSLALRKVHKSLCMFRRLIHLWVNDLMSNIRTEGRKINKLQGICSKFCYLDNNAKPIHDSLHG